MPDQTFGKARRLLKNRDFQKVFSEGEKKVLPWFALHWLKLSGEQETLIGLSVGRKTANAVRRNRIKRRLREIIRTYPQALPRGYWLVVVAKADCAREDIIKLKDSLYLSMESVLRK